MRERNQQPDIWPHNSERKHVKSNVYKSGACGVGQNAEDEIIFVSICLLCPYVPSIEPSLQRTTSKLSMEKKFSTLHAQNGLAEVSI